MRKIFLLLFASLLAGMAAGDAPPEINLFAGRPQQFNGGPEWKLLAAHGRVLALGKGEVTLNLPEIAENSSVPAILEQSGGPRIPVRIWSPRQLEIPLPPPWLAPYNRKNPDAQRSIAVVTNADAFHSSPAQLTLIFPAADEFPFEFPPGTEITLRRLHRAGPLSLVADRTSNAVELNGGGSYVIWRDHRRTAVLFAPGFDFNAIGNILLLRTLTKELLS